MNKKVLVTGFMIICLCAGSLLSDDLYLLSIENNGNLESAAKIVENAYGRIDDRFIVALNKTQLNRLQSADIPLELLAKDIELDQYFLLGKVNPRASKTVLVFESLISSGENYLIKTAEENLDIFRRAGYQVISLDDFQTPLFYNPPVYSSEYRDSYPSDTIADFVVEDSVYNYDARLQAFYTRYIFTDSIIEARDWLVDKFNEFGYTNTQTDLFYYYYGGPSGLPCYNVYCIKEGTTEADKLIVIGGHYDSWNSQTDANIYAPGADDNGSGTAVVLELARIFKNIETKKSIMFIAFAAEEVGLVGSYHAAEWLSYHPYYEVETMLNFDMVGYNENTNNNAKLFSGSIRVYADAFMAAVERVTYLSSIFGGAALNSDHASFDAFGYLVAYAQEGIFNNAGWHTNIDSTSYLDFEYLEQMTRAAAATLGYIDRAAHLTPIEHVWDVGDGQSIMIEWSYCDPTYDYSILYGTSSGNYTDTIVVPSVPPCESVIDGLTEGQTYYFAVSGINPEGYGPVSLMEDTGSTYINPRVPNNMVAVPEYQKILLSWNANYELDLSHYHLLRRPKDGTFAILQDNLTDTTFEDLSAEGHVFYEYAVQAVDNDLNESGISEISEAMAATFDWPLLFVDETSSSGGINPSESDQAELYDSILFANTSYIKIQIDDNERIDRSMAGQFKSIIWLDDDLSMQLFQDSQDSVNWFLDYNTNFCLAGWQTLYWLAGQYPLSPGDFVYDNFAVYQVTDNTGFDFIGAFGQNGWPDLQTSTDNIFSGFLPNVAKYATLPGAQVIYTFNSSSDNPDFENEPCGVLFNNGVNLTIALSFPVFQLTQESSQALMEKILETFGVEIVLLYGDANNSGSINILDLTYMIAYLYKGGPPPPIPNLADANGDCILSLLDITYLIAYLYHGGLAPLPGCVE